MQHFTIKGRLPGLNEYTTANRTNPYAGASMKKKAEKQIKEALAGFHLEPIKKACTLEYEWYEPNDRRDQDNVIFAQKFIQDALVDEGILPDDNRRWVKGSTHMIYTDKSNPRIEVKINENSNVSTD